MNNIYNRYIWLLHTVYQERKVTFERLCDIWKHHFLYNGKPLSLRTFHHHRKMIEENGLEESVFCLSFGLAAKEGKRPPENAVAVCREIGVDISGHKARNLSSLKDLDIFDAFVVMTETQAYVLKQAGVPEDKLYLLGEEEIKDPYGTDLEEFRLSLIHI